MASTGATVRPPTVAQRPMDTASSIDAASPPATRTATNPDARRWDDVRDALHARGLRWTPQRRTLLDVLSRADGHVTGAELVERCRELDPTTIPSTVYRTLDVLEDIGLVGHHHGADGRETFYVQPLADHGHLHCRRCGGSWEIDAREAAGLVDALQATRGFAVDLSHLTVTGRCGACLAADSA